MRKVRGVFVCKRCMTAGGTSHSGFCLSCYNKEYYKKHKKEIIQKSREWAKRNPERNRELKRKGAKKRWDSLTKDEKREITKIKESRRSDAEKERRRLKARKYYHKHKDRIKNKIGSDIPCLICGTERQDTRYISGKCASCYKKEAYKNKTKREDKHCGSCGVKISKYAWFSICRNCRNKDRYKNDSNYREKTLRKSSEYRKKDTAKEKKRIAVIRRRAKITNSDNDLTADDWKFILYKYKNRCAYCGKTGKLEMDHVVPVSKGGNTTKDNIVPACRTCNSRKSNSVGMYVPQIPT